MTNRNALVLISGVPTEMAATDTILGNVSGSAATVTGATQSAVTQLGTQVGLNVKVGTGSTTGTQTSLISSNVTQVLNVSTGATDLITYTLLANTLVTTGQTIIWENEGVWTSSANAKTLTSNFGGTVIRTDSLPTNTAGSYSTRIVIKRTGTNAQSYSMRIIRTVSGGGTVITSTTGTCTETETSNIIIKQTGTGGASSEIGQNSSTISIGLGN